jgi:hypothetical protein
MTTIFSTNNVSKRKLKNLSKRTLGMESLETREMLDSYGVPAPEVPDSVLPDSVQTDAVPAASQDFQTEASAGDITGVAVDVTTLSNVTITATVVTLDSASAGDYTFFYAITAASTDSPSAWIPLDKVVGVDTSTEVVYSFDVTAIVPATSADQYVHFAVEKGDFTSTGTPNPTVATGGSLKISASTNPIYSGDAVTDSVVTISGETTDQVTLTWGKPTKYVDSGDANDGWKAALPSGAKYSINVYRANGTFVKTIDAGTKTTYTITGLPADATATDYKFMVTTNLTLTNPSDRSVPAVAKTGVIIAAGEFTTLAKGAAADVSVGPPTDVKAAYVKPSGTKAASVKVTWKAPVNYTGGYKVTLHDVAAGSVVTGDITKTINPGEKLELTALVGTDITDAHRYKVTVDTTAANGLESTPTYVNVGTVTAVPTKPGAPTVTGGDTSLSTLPGGGKITIAAGTGTGSTAVGFYVGIGATAPSAATATDRAKLIYVPKGTTTTTVDLKLATGDKVWAFAVDAEGNISAASADFAGTAGTDFTADITSALPTTEYATDKDVKGVTATADTTVKNKYTVKWTAAENVAITTDTTGATVTIGDIKYEVTGYRVTAKSKDGSATAIKYVTTANQANGAVFENLNFGTEYTFKVEALITKSVATTTSWTSATTASAISIGSTKTANVATAPTVADAITGITEVTNTGTDFEVTLVGAKSGSTYIVTLTDVNKAVLYSGSVVGGATTTTFKVSTADSNLKLTPKAKYTVTVQTIGSIPGTVSKGKSVTITAADFVSATLKDARGTKVNEVTISVAAPTKGAGAGDKYYIEYTNVVDAKSKPDWNAAKVYTTGTTTDPVAVGGGDSVTIGKLDPNSQYFFRVVTVDKAYVTGTGAGTGWSTTTKVATSKELKIKTSAVPLPTVTKNGFTVDTDAAFGLKLVGNSVSRVDFLAPDAKKVLSTLKPSSAAGDPLYVYTLIASQDSKTDKATGKLLGAETVETDLDTATPKPVTLTVTSANTTSSDKKVTDLTGVATFAEIFTALGVDDTNFSNVKGLNVQIQVDVYYGQADNTDGSGDPNPASDHFTLYSKASKIALPKWFV